MLDLIRLALALLLIFVIPGVAIINLIFPRKGALDEELDNLYRLALGMGMSMVVTIFTGFFLNYFGINPETGMGYLSGPYIATVLIVVSLLAFIGGWWRGAYQFMGNWHPKLIRPSPKDPQSLTDPMFGDKERAFKHHNFLKEKYSLINRISKLEKDEEMHDGDRADYYRDRRLELQKELRGVEVSMVELEQEEESF